MCTSSCTNAESATETEKQVSANKPLKFSQRKIADDAKHLWAHVPGDVTGDGIADLACIHTNSTGGFLGYYEGRQDSGLWTMHTIAQQPPTGGLFASGDLELGDLDGDKDLDVFAVKHPGEWSDAGATAELFWYENKGGAWQPHQIGSVPDAVKDVSFCDFDQDGKVDISILTFDEHTLSIFKQHAADEWERVQFIQNDVLHEGMATGDVDNDGDPDIVATGMIYLNPGSDISQPWGVENLDQIWNNQEGDWSRNGTKSFMHDLDGDGQVEIFMSHSERAGYPLAYYKRTAEGWKKTVLKDSIAACHTLQAFDFDLDGDIDVLAGINFGRAVSLNKDNFDVSIFVNSGDDQVFKEMVIESDGIYNGQALDYDGDGDMDIFRYPQHEATDFYLMENKVRD